MNPAQVEALALLDAQREIFVREFPNRWIAVNANGNVRAADRFDQLAGEIDLDTERYVFAFVAAGAWA